MTDMTLKCEKCGEMVKANHLDAGLSGKCPGCGASILIRAGDNTPPELPKVTPPPPPLPIPPQTAGQTNGFAIASLVLGILSIIPGVYIGGLVMGILAIVFSRMATTRITARCSSRATRSTVATTGRKDWNADKSFRKARCWKTLLQTRRLSLRMSATGSGQTRLSRSAIRAGS